MKDKSENLKENIKIAAPMTDKEIGKTAREIAERGNTAEVKKNKNGILILEVTKKIAKTDKERGASES